MIRKKGESSAIVTRLQASGTDELSRLLRSTATTFAF